MTDPFVAHLSDLSKSHVTRAKRVFVPSHDVGQTLGERIALSGRNWLNLRCVTPLDVALRMGAPFLVERGIDPSEEGLGPALIMRLRPTDGGYLRPFAGQPTMAEALYAAVRDLRMAGEKARDIAGWFGKSGDLKEGRLYGSGTSPLRARESRATVMSDLLTGRLDQYLPDSPSR